MVTAVLLNDWVAATASAYPQEPGGHAHLEGRRPGPGPAKAHGGFVRRAGPGSPTVGWRRACPAGHRAGHCGLRLARPPPPGDPPHRPQPGQRVTRQGLTW